MLEPPSESVSCCWETRERLSAGVVGWVMSDTMGAVLGGWVNCSSQVCYCVISRALLAEVYPSCCDSELGLIGGGEHEFVG